MAENDRSPEQSVPMSFGSEGPVGLVSKAATSVMNFNPLKFASDIRSKSLPKDGMPSMKTNTAAQGLTPPGAKDWRVKLSIPNNLMDSRLLLPLMNTGGFTFPYNPSIIMNNQANYSNANPPHTNYTLNSYNNTVVGEFQINGDFFCANQLEAEYWVAAIHYLRIVTKMRYGENSSEAGTPPPVVMLNGYGDFVFKNVPVIVKSFNVELPADVNYIQTGLNRDALGDVDEGTFKNYAWAPAQSQIFVTCVPQYSRSSISQFNMDEFVRGGYIRGSGGFI